MTVSLPHETPCCAIVLPHDLIVEILSWVPMKYLLRFRCVSKTWKSLIFHPIFVKIEPSKVIQKCPSPINISPINYPWGWWKTLWWLCCTMFFMWFTWEPFIHCWWFFTHLRWQFLYLWCLQWVDLCDWLFLWRWIWWILSPILEPNHKGHVWIFTTLTYPFE